MSEILTPARGYIFAIPVDEIPPISPSAGFSGQTEKFKLETPYKLKVLAVGGPQPFQDGIILEPEVVPGDIISSAHTNTLLREKRATSGFLLNGQQIMVMGFQDILGIWKNLSQ